MFDKKIKDKVEKALATPQAEVSNEISTNVMSSDDLTQSYGDIDREHVNIPRMVMLEQLSPEVGDGLGKSGDFFIKGLNQNLGIGPIEVVVLMRGHSRMRWKDINEGGGILCQALDGKTGSGDPGGSCADCRLKEWSGKTQPQCDLYENFIVVQRNLLAQQEGFPLAISGSRTKLKGLKDFNTILMQSIQQRRPLFVKSYLIKSVEKINPKIPGNNKYHTFQISVGNGNAQLPPEEQQLAYQLFKSFAGRSIHIDQENNKSEADTQTNGPAY